MVGRVEISARPSHCPLYEDRTQHFQRGALTINGRDTEKSFPLVLRLSRYCGNSQLRLLRESSIGLTKRDERREQVQISYRATGTVIALHGASQLRTAALVIGSVDPLFGSRAAELGP